MPNKHKRPPMSVRLPESLRQWVIDRAKSTGQPVNQIVVRAVERTADRCTVYADGQHRCECRIRTGEQR